MAYKPVDTAIVMVVGPCIDDTDFKTLEEAIAYNAAGMDVSLIVEKTDGTTAVTAITLTTAGTSDWTHKDGGYYEIEITAAQNIEEGIAYLRGVCTGVLPFESPRYNIVKANIYDSLVKGTDLLQTDVTQLLGTAWLAPAVAGTPDVNAKQLGGTAQTGRDVGANVLLSSGTGAGQLDFTSGIVKSNLTQILAHLLTQTGTQLADGFEKFFDVGVPTGTVNSLPSAAPDAAGGLPVSDAGGLDLDTKLANTNEVTAARMGALTDWINGGRLDLILDIIAADTTTDIPAKLLKYIQLLTRSDAAIATDNATELTAINADGGSGVGDFSNQTEAIEALRDRGDSAWTTGAGGSDRLLMVDTTIATLASQTSFTLAAGSSDDNAYNNCTIVIEDAATSAQKAVGIISAYTGTTKTVTLKYDPAIFTITTTDKVYILAENALKATLANRQLNVAADGDIAGNIDGSIGSLGAQSKLDVNAECDTALTDYDPPTKAEMDTGHGLLATEAKQDIIDTNVDSVLTDTGTTLDALIKDIPTVAEFEARSDVAGTAATPAEVATALTDIHLDHLLAADYDPALKPGAATALLNELIESDGGVSRYTANALEQAPSAGTNPNVLIDTTIATVTDQTHFTLTAGSNDDDAYKDQAIVLYDASDNDYPSIRVCSAYTGATKTVTLDSAPDFTIIAGDGAKAFVTALGTTAPTVGEIRTEMEGAGTKLTLTLADTDELQTNQGNWATATTIALNAQGKLDVNAEVDTALTDYGANTVIPDAAGTAAALHVTTDGKIDTNTTELDGLQGTDGKALISTDVQDLSASLIVDAEDSVCDAILTGASHDIATSLGRRIRELGAYHISSGTAQTGTAYGITLAAGESASDHIYNRNLLVIQAGTGAGQTRTIVDYNGTSKIAVIDRDWWVNPDATSEYSILPDDTPLVADHGLAQAGSSNTITLRASASSIDSTYSALIIFIMAGTGAGQAKLIDSYIGLTKVVTIHETWTTNPDNSSVYCIIASGLGHTVDFTAEALAGIKSEADDALTDYDPPTRTEATSDKDAIITEVNANETKIDTMQGNVTDILTDTGTTIPGTITTLQADSTAIKAKTDNLPDGIKKNTAITAFTFLMVDSTDHVTGKTGLTIAGNYSGDGGAVAALTNTGVITEISNGLYKIDLTAGELNYDNVTLIFTASGADARIITIHTNS